jgi:hypothetical protein
MPASKAPKEPYPESHEDNPNLGTGKTLKGRKKELERRRQKNLPPKKGDIEE